MECPGNGTASLTVKAVALDDRSCASTIRKATSSTRSQDNVKSICTGQVVGQEQVSIVESGRIIEESREMKIAVDEGGEHSFELQIFLQSGVSSDQVSGHTIAVDRIGELRVIPPGLCLLPTLAIIVAALVTR